jgi:endonuclease I
MKSKLFLLSLTAIILSGCGEQNSSVTSVSLSTSEPTSSVEETSVISSSDTSSVEESSQSEESSSSSAEDDLPEYYRDKGLDITETGATLKTQLFNIIKSPNAPTYSKLYTAYLSTDVKYIDDDGKKHLWDMYSACDYLMPDDENHSNYTKEGDNYNREHTIPQSIFGGHDNYPVGSDLFHVYPTDSFVNGKRGDHPHAEVATASFTSSNGTKVGTSATNNVSGTVCEPADEYKGDFARTYFYFVTCYQDKLSGFGNFATFSKNTYPSLATWAIQLYKKWSDDDPVSQKEIDRNNAAYLVQGNRNPFIDFPNIEDQVWNNY